MFSDLKLLNTLNFNGYILSSILGDLASIPSKWHFIATGGDDMNVALQYAIKHKVPLWGFYTPKLFELISCQTFKEATDLNFVHFISVGGAFFSSAMYERVELEFRKKMTPSNTFFIRKYASIHFIFVSI